MYVVLFVYRGSIGGRGAYGQVPPVRGLMGSTPRAYAPPYGQVPPAGGPAAYSTQQPYGKCICVGDVRYSRLASDHRWLAVARMETSVVNLFTVFSSFCDVVVVVVGEKTST